MKERKIAKNEDGYKPTYKIEGYENITDLATLFEYGVELKKKIKGWDGKNVHELKDMLVSAWEIAKIYNLKIVNFNTGPDVVGIRRKDFPRGKLAENAPSVCIAEDENGNVLYDYQKPKVKEVKKVDNIENICKKVGIDSKAVVKAIMNFIESDSPVQFIEKMNSDETISKEAIPYLIWFIACEYGMNKGNE